MQTHESGTRSPPSPARVPARPTEYHVHAGLGAVVPHVGDHRAVEVCGADFLAAHRLEKGPAAGGPRERARGRRGVREAGSAGLRGFGTRAEGRGCARRRRERGRLPPPQNPYLVDSTFFSNGQN